MEVFYILDAAVTFFPEDVRTQTWDMEEGGIKVTTTYKPLSIDAEVKISKAEIILDIEEGGKKKRVEHLETRKIYIADEFIRIATQTNHWEYVGAFSNFNITDKPSKEQRNIIVLRRK